MVVYDNIRTRDGLQGSLPISKTGVFRWSYKHKLLTERPTLRWVFQRLAGMHRVRVTVQSEVHDLMEGRKEVQIKILRLFGQEVCRLYQISPG